MIVLKDFTEKGNPKRWKKGDAYTGTRGKELAAKGLVQDWVAGTPGPDIVTLPKEKVEVKQEAEKVQISIGTEKRKKK